MTDKQAFYEFAKGFGFCSALVVLFISLLALIASGENKPKEKFKVVDTYRGCDIVRYTDPSNDYRYFLDCKNHDELDNQPRS